MSTMPKPWQRPDSRPSPIDVLSARAEARAYLWAIGDME